MTAVGLNSNMIGNSVILLVLMFIYLLHCASAVLKYVRVFCKGMVETKSINEQTIISDQCNRTTQRKQFLK